MSAAAKPARKGTKGPLASRAEEDAGSPSADVETLLLAERARAAAEQLATSQAALAELAQENVALQERRRHEEREGRDVAALFRAEMTAKGEALAAAQAEVAEREAALAAAQAAAAQREAALHVAFDQERQALVVAAGALQAQLDGVEQWRREKDAAEAEMARLQEENARIADEAGHKIRALQRRLYELGHAEAEDPDGSGGSGPGRPGTGGSSDEPGGDLCLEADLHRLLTHSRRMADEMRQYGQEAEELQKEMKGLESERAALLRDAELAEEMEAQYAKRGTLQAREIRDQKSRITSLEKGIARMAAEFEAEKAALEAGLRAQLADAAAEQNALRRLLQVRTKELRQVRRLAQEVLLQRSDVEAFLVSSIQQVRAEMEAEAAAAAAGMASGVPSMSTVATAGGATAAGRALSSQAGLSGGDSGSGSALAGRSSRSGSVLGRGSVSGGDAGGGSAPGENGGDSGGGASGNEAFAEVAAVPAVGGAAAGAAAGQVDIKQLSWQDRERILRLLFAKINRAVQRPAGPTAQRTQPLSEAQAEVPLAPLRGLATEAGPASLA